MIHFLATRRIVYESSSSPNSSRVAGDRPLGWTQCLHDQGHALFSALGASLYLDHLRLSSTIMHTYSTGARGSSPGRRIIHASSMEKRAKMRPRPALENLFFSLSHTGSPTFSVPRPILARRSVFVLSCTATSTVSSQKPRLTYTTVLTGDSWPCSIRFPHIQPCSAIKRAAFVLDWLGERSSL